VVPSGRLPAALALASPVAAAAARRLPAHEPVSSHCTSSSGSVAASRLCPSYARALALRAALGVRAGPQSAVCTLFGQGSGTRPERPDLKCSAKRPPRSNVRQPDSYFLLRLTLTTPLTRNSWLRCSNSTFPFVSAPPGASSAPLPKIWHSSPILPVFPVEDVILRT
jgi:hypothetical protein